jgi:hypothetical protein
METAYKAFLIRIWQTGGSGAEVWHAVLEDPHTHNLIGFNDLEGLCEYLVNKQFLSEVIQKPSDSNLPTKQFNTNQTKDG